MDDGLIEVIALDSSDLPITQLGFHSKSVVQCKNVVITTTKPIHMKVDGEPVLMKPSTITIALDPVKAPPGKMLRNKKSYNSRLDRMDNMQRIVSAGEALELHKAASRIQRCWRSNRSQ